MGTSSGTTIGAALAATTGPNSIAKDLGDQYEQLYRPGILKVTHPETNEETAFLVLPKGQQAVSVKPFLDELRETPRRRVGTAQLRDAASFIQHVKRYANPDSAIFADPTRTAPKLTAVYDYHPVSPDVAEARFLGHRAVYQLPVTDEWKVWTGQDGKPMNQAEFAQFLEDRISDIIIPDVGDPGLKDFAELVGGRFASPADLLGLARGLSINVDVAVQEARNLSTGEINVKYVEQHRDGAGQPLQIANLFTIAIPVFLNGHRYLIPARLRYRVREGRIAWWYNLVRTDKVFDDAFDGLVKEVREATELPVLTGAPEQ